MASYNHCRMHATVICALFLFQSAIAQLPTPPPSKKFKDFEYFQLALNLEYLEAEFFLYSAYGYGLNRINKNLTGGGPNPIGGRKAKLSSNVEKIAQMLALQEVGHIRIIRRYLGANTIPRPQIDLSTSFRTFFGKALGVKNFNPYLNDLTWLVAAYTLPYVGLTAYVGTNPNLMLTSSKKLLAGVLSAESGQDAILRTMAWDARTRVVTPYGPKLLVSGFTGGASKLRDTLDGTKQVEDENIVVPPALGAEGKTSTNILSANADSLSYARNPPQTLSIVYGTGDASKRGGFFPKGANGNIAKYYLKSK